MSYTDWTSGPLITGTTDIVPATTEGGYTRHNRSTTPTPTQPTLNHLSTQLDDQNNFVRFIANVIGDPGAGYEIDIGRDIVTNELNTFADLYQAWGYGKVLNTSQTTLTAPAHALAIDTSPNLAQPVGTVTLNFKYLFGTTDVNAVETYDIYVTTGPLHSGFALRGDLVDNWTLAGQFTATIPAGTPESTVRGQWRSPAPVLGSVVLPFSAAVLDLHEILNFDLVGTINTVQPRWNWNNIVVVPHREISNVDLDPPPLFQGARTGSLVNVEFTSISYSIQMPNYRWLLQDAPEMNLDGDLTDGRVRFSYIS